MLKKILLPLSLLLFTGCSMNLSNDGYMIKSETTKDTRNISEINIVLNDGILLNKEYLIELSKIIEEEDIKINEERKYKLTNISNEQMNVIVKKIEELNEKNKLNTMLLYREINTIKEEKYSYFIDNYITEIVISNK